MEKKPIDYAKSFEMFQLLGGQDQPDLLDAQLDITGRDVNKRHGFLNGTALHIAAQKDLLEAAKWLINKGADLEAKDREGQNYGSTPLHWAAVTDSVDVARLLISRGAKVNARDRYGQTPLHYAAYSNQLKVAQLLIDNWADKNIKDNYGDKPIDEANSSEMKKLLGGQDRSACMTTNAKACVFPFKYNGVEYNSCTTEGNGDTLWCATSVTADESYNAWGECDTTKCQTE